MRRICIAIVLTLSLLITLSYAGITGKITGRITDSETGEPLAGVNVIIEGTTYGAATDVDGLFIILNISPGNYSVKIIYIGYAEALVKDVVVKIDLTTLLDVKLKQQILQTETVVIEAPRPVVTRDISNSQMNIEAQVVETMPVQTLNQVLMLQAGIEMGSYGILVRGGGANQTVFMIDGLSMNDERNNVANTTLSLNSIQEIQVQTGGFNAEYGEARSGLINAITKEGSVENYNTSISVRYTPAAPKHFGVSLYSPESYFNRSYLDPAVCWTGTDNGAWDAYTQHQYPSFPGGWKLKSDQLLADNNPDNDLSPEEAQRVFQWTRRRQGDIKKPDFVIDAAFGGPIPVISKPLGNLRFFLSYFQEQNMFVYPLSRDSYDENYTQLKLTSDIAPAVKLMVTGQYGEVHSVSPYQWTTTPTGRVLRDQSEVADLLNSKDGSATLYMPDFYSPSDIYRSMVGVKLTHAISAKTFYEVNMQYKHSKYHTFQSDMRDTSKVYEILPEYKVDEAPYGYWGFGTSAIDGMSMGGWMNLGRDQSRNSTYAISADYTTQFDVNHQIKAGLKFAYNDYDINTTTYSPSMSTWSRSQIYQVFPYRLGAYIQDKMEYEGFVANAGVRFDWSDANTNVYDLTIYDSYYRAGFGDAIEEEAPTAKSKAVFTISPRLGIAHPITENAKLYFNYGHFRQEPESSYRFRLQRESNGLVTSIGNPDLVLEKTVAYELGFEQSIMNAYLLKLAGYYKDVTDQPGWIAYRNIKGTVQYSKTENNNYADIRGFELTINKRLGKFFTGFINYTYEVQSSGHFGYLRYYEDPNEQRNYLRLKPEVSKPHARPWSRLNLDFHTPMEFGPLWAGGWFPLGDWRLNILADWRTGTYYTYNPSELPGVVDNTQWRDWWNVDLRLAKSVNFYDTEFQFYMDVSNLFNFKYLNYAGFADNYDWLFYLESLNFSYEEGEEHGSDRIGDYRPLGVAYEALELNPTNDPEITARNKVRKDKRTYIDNPNITSLTFLNPRKFTFGVKISF